MATSARLAALAGLVVTGSPYAQQVPDTTFVPLMLEPAFAPGEGPLVVFDEAHHQSHTLEGTYRTFAASLERAGYVVRPGVEPFTRDWLEGIGVLVVANAIGGDSTLHWPPPAPSAFTMEEIDAVEGWVRAGGALLLLADHMPHSAAAADLADVFGVAMLDGYAIDYQAWDPVVFRRRDGTLVEHEVLDGYAGRVDSVATFHGSAMRPLEGAEPLLMLPEGVELFVPQRPWDIHDATPRIPAGGLLQGLVLHHGDGRVAVFGEAAIFTAQLAGPTGEPMGMNHPRATQNHPFLLNLLHWLAAGSR